jgi:hypothetical protein
MLTQYQVWLPRRKSNENSPKGEFLYTLKKAHLTLWYQVPIYADGRIWIDPKRREERLDLYEKEGISIDKNDHIVDFKKKLVEASK